MPGKRARERKRQRRRPGQRERLESCITAARVLGVPPHLGPVLIPRRRRVAPDLERGPWHGESITLDEVHESWRRRAGALCAERAVLCDRGGYGIAPALVAA